MKVVVGMSGGVDSSVTAALLKRAGHEVTGITMKIWEGNGALPAGRRHGCYGPGDTKDIADARNIADLLGIEHRVIDLAAEYRHEVLDYFCGEYLAGRTPNPCVKCNQRIKFGMLLKKAQESGLTFERFATGHYARVEYDGTNSRYQLKKPRDLKKDQTYFLSALTQEQLALAIFPLGDHLKDEVRQLAFEYGLPVAQKPESQDFAEEGYRAILKGQVRPGNIVNTRGQVLGKHLGIQYYTIGQRKGLGIAAEKPLYVLALDAVHNSVVVGAHEETYTREFTVNSVNWISVEELLEPVVLRVKIRYAHREAMAIVSPLAGERALVRFETPQMAVAPGQTAVFYDGDFVAGGGTIEEVHRPLEKTAG